MSRRLVFCGTIAFLLYIAICIPAGFLIAEGTLHPGRRPLTTENQVEFRATVDRLHARLEEVVYGAEDGALLRAWDVVPSMPNGDAVILLHGMGDNRLGMSGYAVILLNHGFTVLMPDARAHGESGGRIATYGLLERDDIRGWFEWLDHHQHPRCIFGFAESMGAAQLLQALETEPNFCAVAAESPFATFREIAYDRMGQPFHLGPWVGRTLLRPVVESAFLYTRWKYGLDMESVSPEAAVARTHVPIFLIHGQADGNIPVRHSRRIRSCNPSVILWEVPHADHCGAISTAPHELQSRLVNWFLDHTHPRQKLDVGALYINRESKP
jgi:uncharacterized protein